MLWPPPSSLAVCLHSALWWDSALWDADWKGWGLYSRITGVVVAVFYILTSVVTTLDMNGLLPDAPGGLLQRISIISGFGWIMLLALRLLRKRQPAETSRPDNIGIDVQAEA